MNFLLMRDVAKLREEVRLLRNEARTSFVDTPSPMPKPMDSVAEYEALVVRLEDEHFKNNLVRFLSLSL